VPPTKATPAKGLWTGLANATIVVGEDTKSALSEKASESMVVARHHAGRLIDDDPSVTVAVHAFPQMSKELHAVMRLEADRRRLGGRRSRKECVHIETLSAIMPCVYSLVGIHRNMTSETTTTKDRILAAAAKLFHDE